MAETRRRARGRHVGWAMRTPSNTEADAIKTTRCESSLRISSMIPPDNHAASCAVYDNGTPISLPYLKFLLGSTMNRATDRVMPFAQLLIVDEASRLKTPALKKLRDHCDRSRLGMIFVGMPGIEKRLARYPLALQQDRLRPRPA